MQQTFHKENKSRLWEACQKLMFGYAENWWIHKPESTQRN